MILTHYLFRFFNRYHLMCDYISLCVITEFIFSNWVCNQPHDSGHLFWWCHGVYPPLVMENYGPINQGVNYGIVFCGYSVAAFFGPKIAVSIAKSNHGDFSKAFYVAIAVAVVGLILNFVYQKVKGVAQN